MRKFLLALAAVLVVPVLAGAEPVTDSAAQGKLGADGALVLPFGDWGDAAGLGIGATLHYDHPLNENLTLTGRLGYIHHLAKEEGPATFRFSEIPIMVGAKYHLANVPGLYLAGEVGLTHMMFGGEVELLGQKVEIDDSETELGMTLGAGYSMGAWDFAGKLYLPDIGDATGLMAMVGYNFTTL